MNEHTTIIASMRRKFLLRISFKRTAKLEDHAKQSGQPVDFLPIPWAFEKNSRIVRQTLASGMEAQTEFSTRSYSVRVHRGKKLARGQNRKCRCTIIHLLIVFSQFSQPAETPPVDRWPNSVCDHLISERCYAPARCALQSVRSVGSWLTCKYLISQQNQSTSNAIVISQENGQVNRSGTEFL